MANSEDRTRLRHIQEIIVTALRVARGRLRADLDEDDEFRAAILWFLAVMGEAATRVSEHCRSWNPAIPFATMARFRNRLIHGYDNIDADIVWNAVKHKLKPLRGEIRKALE